MWLHLPTGPRCCVIPGPYCVVRRTPHSCVARKVAFGRFSCDKITVCWMTIIRIMATINRHAVPVNVSDVPCNNEYSVLIVRNSGGAG